MHSDWSAITEDCGGWDQYTYRAVQIKHCEHCENKSHQQTVVAAPLLQAAHAEMLYLLGDAD